MNAIYKKNRPAAPRIPRDSSPDSTLALLREGYLFISNRCDRYGSDIFQTRLMLQKTICMRGEEAARIFYDTSRFKRAGAAPKFAQKTLFGQGGVQSLDGDAHRHRKHLFVQELMQPEGVRQLASHMSGHWHSYISRWEHRERVVLYDEVCEILTRSACAWAGVPLAEAEVKERTRDLTLLFDGAGRLGLQHLQARRARSRAERWIGELIKEIRARAERTEKRKPGSVSTGGVPHESALYQIAWHRNIGGDLLPPKVAAVEVLNVVRPVVAIAHYITLAALALHCYPDCRAQLQSGAADENFEFFVQEVRRYYPFFPFAAALVKEEFEWRGYRFPQGIRVLLDLYGTNHHPQLWEQPDEFRPERFRTQRVNEHNLIPQGGGSYEHNHRCPGELITVSLMKVAVDLLCNSMAYAVPEQDLHFSFSEMPATPQSGFVIENVRHV